MSVVAAKPSGHALPPRYTDLTGIDRRDSYDTLTKEEEAGTDLEELITYSELECSTQFRKWTKKVLYITINIVTSVGIIFYNKHAFQNSQIASMPVTVVTVHSACTAVVMYLASRRPLSLFEPMRTPIRSLLGLSMMFPIYVVLGLFSVSHNPIGIYQLGKVMNSPVVVLLNYVLFSSRVSFATVCSIVMMTCGVAATIKEGWNSTSAIGLLLVCTSTCAAALYQIAIGQKHKELGISSPQLIFQQSRLSAILLVPLIPFVDTLVNPLDLSWTAISGLLGTGVVASIVNLSQFLVIESTSALTFNVASQIKTCSVLVIAWLMADRPPSLLDLLGVTTAMIGSACYACIALSERGKVVIEEKPGVVKVH